MPTWGKRCRLTGTGWTGNRPSSSDQSHVVGLNPEHPCSCPCGISTLHCS
jgi:hypothetical protein